MMIRELSFSSEQMSKLLGTTEFTEELGPDSPRSFFLRDGGVTSANLFTAGNPLQLFSSKNGNSTALTKSIQIVHEFMNYPDNHFQFPYKQNRASLNAGASLLHYSYMHLKTLINFAVCSFCSLLISIRLCSAVSPNPLTEDIWLSQTPIEIFVRLFYQQNPPVGSRNFKTFDRFALSCCFFLISVHQIQKSPIYLR